VKLTPTAQASEGKIEQKLNAPQKSELVKPAPTAQVVAPELRANSTFQNNVRVFTQPGSA
jgi:hypothetical protein